MSEIFDVGAFHRKFGLPYTTTGEYGPREVPQEVIRFRIQFMLEELLEFVRGAGGRLVPEYDPIDHHLTGFGVEFNSDEVDHVETFDALIDLVYVALGTVHLFGYPWHWGWNSVQQANMRKVRAFEDGSNSKRGSRFDVVKPEGWEPPNIAGILRNFGWEV